MTENERKNELLRRPSITVQEYAEIEDISRGSAYDAIGRGDVEHYRVGKLIKIRTAPLRRRYGMAA